MYQSVGLEFQNVPFVIKKKNLEFIISTVVSLVQMKLKDFNFSKYCFRNPYTKDKRFCFKAREGGSKHVFKSNYHLS